MDLIAAEGIEKRFGQLTALRDISLRVRRGELYGLIGPDGAGKTTFFRILTTLMPPDGGRATVDGLDIATDYRRIRAAVGYMPGRFSLYPDLTVKENLEFFATLFGTRLEDNYDLIRDIYVQIEPFRSRRAGRLSGGMKQKLALCCALIHRPRVLFLDEPTVGVDVQSKNIIIDYLKELNRGGMSILYTSHHLQEAQDFCDRVGILNEGQLLKEDTPQNLITEVQAFNLEEAFIQVTGKR